MCPARRARSVATMRPAHLPHRFVAAGFTVAATLVAPTTALAADAVYGGSSRDKDAIVLKTDAQSTTLRSIVIGWRATCDDGSWIPGGGTLTPAVPEPGFEPDPSELLVSQNGKGRFKGTQLSTRDFGDVAAGISVEIQGKLKPDRATGTVKVKVAIIDKATGVAVTNCRVTQNWSASHAPGTVYGGTTSQGAPVVLRLVGSRKRVSDIFLSWSGPCTPSGSYWSREHLGNFNVKANGSFGNPFSDELPLEDGGKRAYDYTFTGKLSKAAGKGRLQFKISETDAAGVAGSSCDTGAVTWKVAST